MQGVKGSRLVGAVAAAGEARAMGGMGAGGLRVGGSFGFRGVVPSPHAVGAVADPRAAAIPAEGAGELASVAGAGLVRAGHGVVTVAVSVISAPKPSALSPNWPV
jgi:hypothetical protein